MFHQVFVRRNWIIYKVKSCISVQSLFKSKILKLHCLLGHLLYMKNYHSVCKIRKSSWFDWDPKLKTSFLPSFWILNFSYELYAKSSFEYKNLPRTVLIATVVTFSFGLIPLATPWYTKPNAPLPIRWPTVRLKILKKNNNHYRYMLKQKHFLFLLFSWKFAFIIIIWWNNGWYCSISWKMCAIIVD